LASPSSPPTGGELDEVKERIIDKESKERKKEGLKRFNKLKLSPSLKRRGK
jgi:hypothetical protein